MPLYAVHYEPGPNWPAPADARRQLVPHGLHLDRLMREGNLVWAGPYDGGGGLALFEAFDEDSVREWVHADPAVRGGMLWPRIAGWRPLFERERGVSPFGRPAG